MATMVATRKAAWPAVRDLIAERRDWINTSCSLRGEALPGGPGHLRYGRLPEELRAIAVADNPGYVVYSYATPIAWYDRTSGQWRIPNEHYSPTTSCHQKLVFAAISHLTGRG